MKKFFTLIAAAFCLNSISAQTIGVTVDGTIVQDGQTIEILYSTAVTEEIIPGLMSNYGFEPEVVVTSNTAQEVTVSVEDLDKTEDHVQNCFTNCITCSSSNEYKVIQTKDFEGSADAKIHVEFGTGADCPITAPYSQNVNVTISTSAEQIAFTMILTYDPTRAAAEQSPIISGGKSEEGETKTGDIDNDGKITISDITKLIEYYLSMGNE